MEYSWTYFSRPWSWHFGELSKSLQDLEWVRVVVENNSSKQICQIYSRFWRQNCRKPIPKESFSLYSWMGQSRGEIWSTSKHWWPTRDQRLTSKTCERQWRMSRISCTSSCKKWWCEVDGSHTQNFIWLECSRLPWMDCFAWGLRLWQNRNRSIIDHIIKRLQHWLEC